MKTACCLVALTLFWPVLVPAESEQLVFRIDAVPSNAVYDQDSSFSVRCRFLNKSGSTIQLVLRGVRRRLITTSLAFGLILNKEGENSPLLDIKSDFKFRLCKDLSMRTNADVRCYSPEDVVTLRPHEQIVRTIYLRSAFKNLGFPENLAQGVYRLQISSPQIDSVLFSNELLVHVRGRK